MSAINDKGRPVTELFNSVLQKIMKTCEEALEVEGIKRNTSGGKEVKCLVFADDLVLLSHNEMNTLRNR